METDLTLHHDYPTSRRDYIHQMRRAQEEIGRVSALARQARQEDRGDAASSANLVARREAELREMEERFNHWQSSVRFDTLARCNPSCGTDCDSCLQQ